MGANGAGKTTLLRTISGVQPISSGTIEYRCQLLTRSAPRQHLRAGICPVPEGRQVFGLISIEDNLRLGAYTRPAGEVAAALERMYTLFPVLKERRPSLLQLDEPSMGLAPLLIAEIFRTVERLRAQGITILLVEQNAHAALAIADKGYVIESGKIILSGPGAQLLENEQVRSAYLGM